MTETPIDLPPAPEGPTEKERAALVLKHALRAVEFTRQPSPMWRSAEQEFFQSWLTLAQSVYDDAEESEHRRLAWDRVEQLEESLSAAEAKLGQISEIVASAETRDDDAKAFAFGRIEEVLSS